MEVKVECLNEAAILVALLLDTAKASSLTKDAW